jgi:hypothetical protein
VRRLEADDAAASRGDADGTGRVGAEGRVAEPHRERDGRTATRSTRVAVRGERVADIPKVLVLGGDPVRELVQIGLADDRVARVLQKGDRRRRPGRDVLGEDR